MNKTLEELRHARSKKDFPFLTLEEGEYVELIITRTKYSLFFIWFTAIVTLLILLLILILLPKETGNAVMSTPAGIGSFITPLFLILFIFIVGVAFVATKVHFGNKLFVTNKRIIQLTETGLFAKSTNVIELSRIEDVSFKQIGIIQTIFHYGTIRMSTVGDETTYTFPFVDTPTDEIQTISHLIHTLKGDEK